MMTTLRRVMESEHLNRANVTAVIAGGVILMSMASLFGPREDSEPAPVYTMSGKVKRVVSGHKIKLDSDDHVIYAGIRAPRHDDPFGETAIERNRELVEDERIRLRFDEQQKDKKGRFVGYIFANGELINVKLVEEGLAYVRLKSGERRFAKELLEAQSHARKAHRGIWSRPIRSDETRYFGDAKHGAFHRPGCADVANIHPGDRIEFKTASQAFDAGFAPCGHCKP